MKIRKIDQEKLMQDMWDEIEASTSLSTEDAKGLACRMFILMVNASMKSGSKELQPLAVGETVEFVADGYTLRGVIEGAGAYAGTVRVKVLDSAAGVTAWHDPPVRHCTRVEGGESS